MNKSAPAFVFGIFVFLGLAALGYLLSDGLIRFKEYERTVIVKGLSEREYPADVAVWPIQINRADNDLTQLYEHMADDIRQVSEFLGRRGFEDAEITLSPPTVTDKLAQQYGGDTRVKFRFVGAQTITVYSHKVDQVRNTQNRLATLGKQGIVFSGKDYGIVTEYLFTRLNDVKPEMIEEATLKAREVGEKFAHDSHSKLGKIKHARQGRFSIDNRDPNTPYIKKVRVVSTIEYYLSD